MIDHSWLNDFFSLEDSPSDSIDIVLAHIQLVLTVCAYCLISDHLILVQVSDQWVDQLLWNEEFIVSFLEHIAVLWTPTILRVRALCTVYLWL